MGNWSPLAVDRSWPDSRQLMPAYDHAWGAGVVGSNPAAPTKIKRAIAARSYLHSIRALTESHRIFVGTRLEFEKCVCCIQNNTVKDTMDRR